MNLNNATIGTIAIDMNLNRTIGTDTEPINLEFTKLYDTVITVNAENTVNDSVTPVNDTEITENPILKRAVGS